MLMKPRLDHAIGWSVRCAWPACSAPTFYFFQLHASIVMYPSFSSPLFRNAPRSCIWVLVFSPQLFSGTLALAGPQQVGGHRVVGARLGDS